MYELKKLSRVYPKGRGKVAALSGVDLDIPDGEFITVQGLTGHGKTTFLQMLGALDKPTSGKIIFDGKDLGAMPESQLVDVRAQNFGFIFQNYNLLPTLTAEENVEAALVPLRIPTAERRARSVAALAEVGLGDRASHFPPEMSGGEQQRVAIARALVKEPKVILADEPTGNLDEVTSLEIIGLMEKLWKRARHDPGAGHPRHQGGAPGAPHRGDHQGQAHDARQPRPQCHPPGRRKDGPAARLTCRVGIKRRSQTVPPRRSPPGWKGAGECRREKRTQSVSTRPRPPASR